MNAENVKQARLTKAGQIWLIICIIANAGLLIYTFFVSDFGSYTPVNYLALITAAFVIAGFSLLLSGRKLGFIIVCACVLLNVLASILQGTVSAMLIGSAVVNLFLTAAFIGTSLSKMIPINLRKSLLSIVMVVLLVALGTLTIVFSILPNEKSEITYTYDGPVTIQDENGNTVMEPDDFDTARMVEYKDQWYIAVTLSAEGQEKFKRVAAENIGKELSIRIGSEEILRPLVSADDNDLEMLVFSALTDRKDARALSENINSNLQKYPSS